VDYGEVLMKASPIINSFNGGEISPLLAGRVDLDKYRNSCLTLENFLPTIYGPAVKRPGTRFVAQVKNAAHTTILVSFEFSVSQAYILEFGDNYMRVYKDGGKVLDSGGVNPYEIVTPYSHTDVSDLKFAQSADVMYIAHPDYPPQKLSREDHDDWTIEEIVFDWPPFNDINTTNTSITASAVTGTGITLTASASLFESTDVGQQFKFSEVIESAYAIWESDTIYNIGDYCTYGGNVYKATNTGQAGTIPPVHTEGSASDPNVIWEFKHDGAGYVEVTGYTSATVVTADVVKGLPESTTSGSTRWSRGAWSDEYGYPRALAFHEDRLWWAGTSSKPQTMWASVSGDYENHKYGSNDDDALNYTISSQDLNVIEWLAPGRFLVIGTSGGEFVATGSRPEEAITPTNVRIARQTTYGSSGVTPYRVGNALLFAQRARRKIREFTYQFETDSYTAPDMSRLSEHILNDGNGLVDMAYQQEPYQILWAPRSDGTLAGMTYERMEDVVGWHRQVIGGDGEVESVASIPHWDGDQDSTWIVVKRTINGADAKFVEYIEKTYDDQDDSFYVDSGLTYEGSPVSSVSGLSHLEGETVDVLIDGAAHPQKTVSSGGIDLDWSGSKIHVGLHYDATIKTMNIEAGSNDGTAQGKQMVISGIVIRLLNTGSGLFYGGDMDDMDEVYLRNTDDDMDEAVPLFSGDTDVLAWPGEHGVGANVVLKHVKPLPCTVVALMPKVHTSDDS
jgi:hypothetical protein